MLKMVGKLKQDALPMFVTVTYPDNFPFEPEIWQKHIAALWRRVRRKWPEVAAIWKKEFKRRRSGANAGKVAPHFHMLVWGVGVQPEERYDWVKYHKMLLARVGIADGQELIKRCTFLDGLKAEIEDLGPDVTVRIQTRSRSKGDVTSVEYWRQDGVPHLTALAKELAGKQDGIPEEREPLEELRAWFSVAWAEIVSSDDPRHLVAGTRVEMVKSVRGVFSYAAKYLGKREEDVCAEYERIGRCWGVLGREFLPWASVTLLPLGRDQAVRLRRAALRYLTAERRKRQKGGPYRCRSEGLFWFSSGPPAWVNVARRAGSLAPRRH